MTRRNTIIVAVLVNAVLLTLLFVTAVTHDDEYYAQSQIPALDKEEKPIDFSLLSDAKQGEQPTTASLTPAPVPIPVAALPASVEAVPAPLKAIEASKTVTLTSVDEKIVHKLPEAMTQIQVETAQLTPKEPKFKEIVVKKGDSLEKIAKTQKVSLDEIVKLNRLPNSFLRIGQVLKLPEPGAIAAKTVEKPKESATSQYYIVKAGDNPWTIAMKHHMKVEELLRLNHIDKEKAKRLKPGDKLRTR